MKTVLVASSLVVLAFTGLFVFEEKIGSGWRAHQVEYRRLLAERAFSEGYEGEISFPIELRQVYLPEMKRVDRCVTCHVSIEDPRFASESNPLKTHPGDYLEHHDPARYGCTVCHDGQGRATTWEDALAVEHDKHWPKPVLKPPFLEANCYRCHTGELDQTPTYNRGKRLFEKGGCLGCHQRDGKGGYLAPELRGIGDAAPVLKHPTEERRAELLARFHGDRNLAYIYESVRFPLAQPADSVMLDYGFSDEEALALTVYLKSLTRAEPGVPTIPGPVREPLPLLERGRTTYELYCRACHGPQGAGGVENPNYVNDTMPELNLVAERMFLFEREDAEILIEAVRESGNLNEADPAPDLPRFPVCLAQYNAIRDVILNGNPAGKADPEGPSPFNMPSWKKSIPEHEVDAVIAYLVSIYEFEEYDE